MRLPGIGIGTIFNKFGSSGGGFDPDAQAFITAAGITDPTQQTAINNLVLALKADNLWSLGYYLYPLVGGSATSHKYNLLNPADSNAAFRVGWSGGITHDANGVTGNGTNGYGNTYFNDDVNGNLDSTCIFMYSRTNNSGSWYDMGTFDSSTTPANCQVMMQARYVDFMVGALNQDDPPFTPASTDSTGFHAVSRVNSTQEIRNIRGTNTTYSRTSKDKPNLNEFLMAVNFNGSGFGYSNRNYACFGRFQGLTTTQLNLMNTIIVDFQTALGRNV